MAPETATIWTRHPRPHRIVADDDPFGTHAASTCSAVLPMPGRTALPRPPPPA